MSVKSDEPYTLNVDSVFAWTRRGPDFCTPKYRSMLISSVAVFLWHNSRLDCYRSGRAH